MDEVASEVMQSESSIEITTNGESATAAQKNIDAMDENDASASEQLQAPLPDEPYATSVHWGEGPYKVSSLFGKATSCAQI